MSNTVFAYLYLLSLTCIPVGIIAAVTTLIWLIIKRASNVNALTWGSLFAITSFWGFISYFNFFKGYLILISESLTLIAAILLVLVFIKHSTPFMKIVKIFLPVAIPLTAFFYFLLYFDFRWTLQGSQYGSTDIATSGHGFPLPADGVFYAFAYNTGDIWINNQNLIIDLSFYFLLAIITIYFLRKWIDFSRLLTKILLIIFCGIFYCYSWGILGFYYASSEIHNWPDKIQILGLKFQFLGL
jgi:hypothetical protein